MLWKKLMNIKKTVSIGKSKVKLENIDVKLNQENIEQRESVYPSIIGPQNIDHFKVKIELTYLLKETRIIP